MAMSRDGLLPKSFGKVNKKYQTPGFSTVIAGVLVAGLVLVIDDKLVTDLTSIGTLFAFVLVSGCVLMLPRIKKEKDKFSIPYINAQYIFPLMYVLTFYLFQERTIKAVVKIGAEGYQEVLFLIFMVLAAILAVLSFVKKYSLIPVLGVACCMYLMVEIPAKSWIVFWGWMAFGLSIYLLYGKNNSKLNK